MQLTSPAQRTRQSNPARLALVAFLGAESVFFGTLFMVYLYLRTAQTGMVWANQAHDLLLPSANTLLLLLSTLSAWQAVRAIQRGEVRRLELWLLVTIALGVAFIGGQLAEFSRSGMRPDDGEFGNVFFTLLGFHGLHVLAGVIILSINLVRARLGDFNAQFYSAVELGSWFWYYVAGVWVVLFAALYLL